MPKFFRIKENVKAKTNSVLNTETAKDFWRGCSFRTSELECETCEELIFSIGNATPIFDKDSDYAINIEESGVFVSANDEKGLIRGFITLCKMIKTQGDEVVIECKKAQEKPFIGIRMAHLCIFNNTEEFEIEKFVRFCGALKFTHVIFEFWGMLKYDCMKELSWGNAYSKEQIKRIVKIANEMGVEIIPMFNHWGHASASRCMHGKHVVLDQNPSLQPYFSDTGWCWNYDYPKTRALLRKVREELIEVCGKGEYFHIGCDEAYGFDFSNEAIDGFCSYVNEVTEELRKEGRRPLMWGDMLVCKRAEFNPKNRYTCNCETLDSEKRFLNLLNKDIIIADWQYDSPVYPVETSKIFADAGFEVIICPWDRGCGESEACIKTAKDGLLGIMHTTWHTLSSGFGMIYYIGEKCWNDAVSGDWACLCTNSASILRKCYFANGDYRTAGWSQKEIIEKT